MAADPRVSISDPRATLTDPRLSSLPEPRLPLSVCTCGLPNCPRVGPHGGPPHHPPHHHPGGFSPESPFPSLAMQLGGAHVGHIDPAVLYSMQGAYGLKESPEMLRTLPQLNGYYPYDPTSVYPYVNGYGGIDARRKNATKESTNTLKAWLFEHRKNPYPTKGEKIMLAILTKMTLTQVSTWFANARRRLKKDNKVTWTSKDDIDMDDEDDSERNSDVDVGDRRDAKSSVAGVGSGNAKDSRHKVNGSIGEDDDDEDALSVTSGGDRSEIDVEDHDDPMEVPRIPPLLPHTMPHTMPHNGAHPMFLTNHRPHMFSPLVTSHVDTGVTSHYSKDGDFSGKLSSPGARPSDKQDTTARPLSPISPCSSKSSHVTTMTPPPSPKDVDQSTPSTHTIHHRPSTSLPRHSVNASPGSTQSPTKPKIWSIADVVSDKDANDNDTKSDVRGSVSSSRNVANVTNSRFPVHASSPSTLLTVGGVAATSSTRMDHLTGSGIGIPHPSQLPVSVSNSDPSSAAAAAAAYSLAYYPYGLPNPAAAAAIMASQASHLAAASRVHPYSRFGGFPGHPTAAMHHPLGYPAHPSAMVQGRADYAGGLPMGGRPSAESVAESTPERQKRLDSQKASDISTKPGSTRPESTLNKCTPTAFTPVAQRQM